MTTATSAAPGTATLQMIRAEVNAQDFQRWMGVRGIEDPDHAMHCLLTECFGDLAPKPFRLILPHGKPDGYLYGYGQSGADELREAAAICADPLQARIIPASTIDTKPMPTEWRADKQLGFEVRIRPIIRKSWGSGRKETELDVFQAKAEAFSHGEMPYSREQVYSSWLSDQLTRIGGASLGVEGAKLMYFQRTRAARKPDGYSEGPDARMRGILTVTDSAAFNGLLARGVGRHRAYGYGMVLLRPARE